MNRRGVTPSELANLFSALIRSIPISIDYSGIDDFMHYPRRSTALDCSVVYSFLVSNASSHDIQIVQ